MALTYYTVLIKFITRSIVYRKTTFKYHLNITLNTKKKNFPPKSVFVSVGIFSCFRLISIKIWLKHSVNRNLG